MSINLNNQSKRFVSIERCERMQAILKVIGVGGGGCNAIESMIKKGLTGVEFIAVNTDAQALSISSADKIIQIGESITRGLGAGANPEVGKRAAEEDRDKIAKALEGSDMVFVTAGMGGGTGTGAAPIVASIAKNLGALVVGIVTKPFRWEGKMRMQNAERGIQELRQYVDSLIVIPNERLLSVFDPKSSAREIFNKPNEVLYDATRGIVDIIQVVGVVNVDFADVKTVMSQSGDALMGCGVASGENRAIEAAQKAISSPLLEGVSFKGAKRILVNVTTSSNVSMDEIDQGNEIIFKSAGEDANVIFGWVIKEEMNEYVSYTVIATGFSEQTKNAEILANKNEQNVKTTQSQIQIQSISLQKEDEEREAYPKAGNDDLTVPTIFRAAQMKRIQREASSANSEEIKGVNNNSKNSDDEDSDSSFLKMLMD